MPATKMAAAVPAAGFALFAAMLCAQTNPVEAGIAAFNRGDYKTARLNLERAPADPQARLFLALTKAATGECAAAVPNLAKAFSGSGNQRLAGLALAQCHIGAKRFAEAGAIIAQLEKQFPADADVLYVSANYRMKAWNDAIYRMYQKAPSSYRVDQLSAEVFETQGKYGEAVAEYRKTIEKNPKAIDLHYRPGRALLQQSHDAAVLDQIALLERAVRLQPRNEPAHYNLMMVY